MNQKLLLSLAFTAMLSGACAPLDAPPRPDLWGDPAPVSAASRTIVITSNTRYVNVTGGEVVTFVVGDKAFAWSFNGMRYVAPFDLSMTAPAAGVLDHAVIAYVAPDPRYLGGGGHGSHGEGHGGHGGGGGHGGK